MRRLRRWWWRRRGKRWEQCDGCGRPVKPVYLAADRLWRAVVVDVLGHDGSLCIECFDRGAYELGVYICWDPVVLLDKRPTGSKPWKQ